MEESRGKQTQANGRMEPQLPEKITWLFCLSLSKQSVCVFVLNSKLDLREMQNGGYSYTK